MAIPISDIIQVNIAVSPNAVAVEGFGPLLFLSKQFVPVPGERVPVRQYTSMAAVSADFPSGEIYNAALAWFSQKPTPKYFLVGAITHEDVTPATSGSVTASAAATLETITALTNGVLSINVDGVDRSTAPINFSSAHDFDAATSMANAALVAAGIPVTMSNREGTFKIVTKSVGANSIIGDVYGSAAPAFKLDAESSPVYVHGTNEVSVGSDLNAILNSTFDFFFVAIDRKYRGSASGNVQMTVAKWAEANEKVFGWADSDPQILVVGAESSFKRAKEQNLQRTLLVYDASDNGDEYPEISILGRASTVNFNVANSALVLAFKQGPAIKTADLSPNQLAALERVNGNAFINVGGNTMFYNGKMADGTWFDTVQGVSWLTSKVRANVFNLFYTSTTKIPWTDTGVALVNQQVTLALELAVTNGLIAPGYDNEGNFYPDGYKVLSTDLALMQSQKGARIWEGTSFIAIGSGALQGAVISGNFVQ